MPPVSYFRTDFYVFKNGKYFPQSRKTQISNIVRRSKVLLAKIRAYLRVEVKILLDKT